MRQKHALDLCRMEKPPATKNSSPKPKKKFKPRSDIFEDFNRAALPQLESLCRDWLPGGRRTGVEWVVRNPLRVDRKPGSFKVNISNGRWADFATDDRGGDPISLHAYLSGSSQIEAAQDLASRLGVST